MANFKKLNYESTLAILRHNYRTPATYSNESIDPARREDNINLFPTRTYQEAKDKLKRTMEEVQHAKRKDGVCSLGYVITLPEEVINEKQETEFWQLAKNQLIDRFGESNILTIQIHYDENRPHLHAVIMPIRKEEGGSKKGDGSSIFNKVIRHGVGHKDLQKRIRENKDLKHIRSTYREDGSIEKKLNKTR